MKNLIISFGFEEGVHKVSIRVDLKECKKATDEELANLIRNTIAVLRQKEGKKVVVQ